MVPSTQRSHEKSNDSTSSRCRFFTCERFLLYFFLVGQALVIQNLLAQNASNLSLGSSMARKTVSINNNNDDDDDSSRYANDFREPPSKAHFYCLCPTRKDKCNADMCDTIITFQDPSNAPFNLPNSTWTTARNVMYYLAKQRRYLAQLSGQRPPESHYCFMDGDSILNHPKAYIQDRLANETELDRIIFFNYHGYFKQVRYAFGGDGNCNCFSGAFMDQYLPYSTIHDDQAWYLSQADLILRASTIRPFAFKLYPEIVIRNKAHNNDYPRDGEAMKGPLEKRILQGFQGCHPNNHAAKPPNGIYNCSYQGRWVYGDVRFNRTHIVFAR